MFCCTLLYVHSSIAIILMEKIELIALLNLFSWCLVMVERLFLAVPRGCLQFVIVVFPDHTHLLFLIRSDCETDLSPPFKYLTDRYKAALLLWIFYVLSALCLLCFYARLFIFALWSPAGKGLTSWLSFVVYNWEYVTFPLVSWVRCDT